MIAVVALSILGALSLSIAVELIDFASEAKRPTLAVLGRAMVCAGVGLLWFAGFIYGNMPR